MQPICGWIFFAASSAIALAADSSSQPVAATPSTQPTTPSAQPATAPSTQPTFPRDIWTDVAGGRLMLRSFDTAPYPHASRDAGYKNVAGDVFSRDEHYADSTVGIFVPPGFDPTQKVNYVLHFHGHKNNVANVLTQFNLPENFAALNTNAILIVPQGPFMAPDSGGGKLELDAGGFERFITQITDYLAQQKVISNNHVGKIVLGAHSGGYKVTAGILHLGGMSDHISDVLLYDASYGSLSYFVDFVTTQPDARLISFHTQHLDDENLQLQKLLDERKIPWRDIPDASLNPQTIAPRGVTFVSTPLAHNDALMGNDHFKLCLETSPLPTR